MNWDLHVGLKVMNKGFETLLHLFRVMQSKNCEQLIHEALIRTDILIHNDIPCLITYSEHNSEAPHLVNRS